MNQEFTLIVESNSDPRCGVCVCCVVLPFAIIRHVTDSFPIVVTFSVGKRG
jgi:hypothetical protein